MESKSLIAVLGAAHSLSHSFFLVVPPLIPMLTISLRASEGEIAWIASAAYLLYGLGSFFSGALTNRFGASKVVVACLIMIGISPWIMQLVDGFVGLAIGLVLFGAFGSQYHPAASTFISLKYGKETPSAYAVHGVIANVGQILMPAGAVVLATVFGWKSPFLVLGVVSVAVGLLVPVVGERTASTVQRTNPLGSGRTRLPLSFYLKGSIAALLLHIGLRAMAFRGVQLFFPHFLVSEAGFSEIEAGLAASGVVVFGVVGQYLGGWATNRIGPKRTLAILTPTISLAIAVLVIGSMFPLSAAAFVVLFGLTTYGTQPAGEYMTVRVSSRSERGPVFGAMYLVSFTLGAASASLAGALVEEMGLIVSMTAMCLFPAFSVISLLRVHERQEHD